MNDSKLQNCSLGFLGEDMTNKLVLVGLICYLTNCLKTKKPNVTHLEVIKSLVKELSLPNDFINSLAIICTEFAYGCIEFPTFGVSVKDMQGKIKDLLKNWVPF